MEYYINRPRNTDILTKFVISLMDGPYIEKFSTSYLRMVSVTFLNFSHFSQGNFSFLLPSLKVIEAVLVGKLEAIFQGDRSPDTG